MSIEVYEHGVMLRTPTAFYAIDPLQVAQVLAAEMPEAVFDTKLLTEDILRIYQQGNKRVVFSYRKPQKTGIWLEGEADALQVPMPGLVLARKTDGDKNDGQYAICAVQRRPSLGMPNTGHNGICWGNISRPQHRDNEPYFMSADWSSFFGTAFNNHSVNGKATSPLFKEDVRNLLRDLSAKKAKHFPKSELVPLNSRKASSFADWMQEIVGK